MSRGGKQDLETNNASKRARGTFKIKKGLRSQTPLRRETRPQECGRLEERSNTSRDNGPLVKGINTSRSFTRREPGPREQACVSVLFARDRHLEEGSQSPHGQVEIKRG